MRPTTQEVIKQKMKRETTKKELKSMAAKLGSFGGKSTFEKRGNAYMKKIGKRGAKARWSEKPK